MPDTRPGEEPTPEEPGNATPSESADEREDFPETRRESMEEYAELGRLLAEWEKRCRESRELEQPEDLPHQPDSDAQHGRRGCPDS